MRLSPRAVLALMLCGPAASAEEACSGSIDGVGCFDAAPQPGPAEPSPFRWLARGNVLGAGNLAGTILLRHASTPAELVVASPDPSGRLVPVVQHSTQLDARIAAGLGRGFDLTMAMKLAIDQAGSGPNALSTQVPTPLKRTAFGDPRLALRKSLPSFCSGFAWAARFELSVPFGDERGFVGERSLMGAAALNGHYGLGKVSLATDAGLRVLRSTRFGDVNLGSHAFLGLGVDYAAFSSDLLHLSVEALFRPMLVDAPRPLDAAGYADWVMPAESLVGLSSRPSDWDLWLSLGGGTGIPLSHRSQADARMDSWFVSPSTPRWQLFTSVSIRN